MACRLMAMFMACRTRLSTKGTLGSSLSGLAKYSPPKYQTTWLADRVLETIFIPLATASFCRARSTSEMWTSSVSRVARRVTPSGTQRNSNSLYSGVCRQWFSTRLYRTCTPSLRSTNSKGPVPTTFLP